jgi:hypothetical protein
LKRPNVLDALLEKGSMPTADTLKPLLLNKIRALPHTVEVKTAPEATTAVPWQGHQQVSASLSTTPGAAAHVSCTEKKSVPSYSCVWPVAALFLLIMLLMTVRLLLLTQGEVV